MTKEEGINPLISILMPVYNAEKFVAKSIESILGQTYTNWELIIVNDKSTDFSKEIIQRYCSDKIRLFDLDNNSGAAYIPRKKAFEESLGEWIINLDADDFLSNTYIYDLLNRALNTNADICCGQMIIVDELSEQPKGWSVPDNEFDFQVVFNGETAFLHTVPDYIIGLNGILARRNIWSAAYEKHILTVKPRVHDDEMFFRLALLESNIVSFSKSTYWFRENATSVTANFDQRVFEFADTLLEFQRYIKERFGEESILYSQMALCSCNYLFNSLGQFILNGKNLDMKQLKQFNEEMKVWHKQIDWKSLRNELSFINFHLFKRYSNFFFCAMLRKHNLKSFIFFMEYFVKQNIIKILNNKYYLWLVTRKQREKNLLKELSDVYSNEDKTNKSNEVIIVNIYQGKVHAGGLADRFKGIISTYYVCKKYNLNYKLLYTDPFPLTDFLVPNTYDWSIEQQNISYDLDKIKRIVLDTTQDTAFQHKKQKKYMLNKISKINKQTHVYTNAGFAYEINYSELFSDLFKPSKRLAISLEKQQKEIGGQYISVSCRFLDLLGDFNEPFGYHEQLTDYNAEKLIRLLLEEIQNLHIKYPKHKILVNSDSKTFLERVKVFRYVFVIDGNIIHIDNSLNLYTYEMYEKTFLDFFAIAQADHIFLLQSGKMFYSGYPLAASKIYNRPFQTIKL